MGMPTLRVPIWKTNTKFIPVNERGLVDHPKFLHSVARSFLGLKNAITQVQMAMPIASDAPAHKNNPWIKKD